MSGQYFVHVFFDFVTETAAAANALNKIRIGVLMKFDNE
jgi:hypothetical protein